MKNEYYPELLFKYKTIETGRDIERVLDILMCNRIYAPKYYQLNDPLEGAGYNITLDGWPGMGMQIAADVELEPIESAKQRFRILSLSTDPVSPQLWAHYANNYSGICLCFSTEKTFGTAKSVTYDSPNEERFASEPEEIEAAVYENFFYKHQGWSYEKEWRMVQKDNEKNDYIYFGLNELKAIIVGNRLDEKKKKLLIEHLPKGIKVLKAMPGYQKPKINLLPYDYSYDDWTGERIKYIEDLKSYICN